MKKIRKNVFETNSSSSHSISIENRDEYYKPTNEYFETTISYGEYGWGYKKLNTIREKLEYIITATQYYDAAEELYLKWIKEVYENYTNNTLKINDHYKGFIDHQSQHKLDEYFVNNEEEFKENMKEIIFNKKYSIIIDNDNH